MRKKLPGLDGDMWRAFLHMDRLGVLVCSPTEDAEGQWQLSAYERKKSSG